MKKRKISRKTGQSCSIISLNMLGCPILCAAHRCDLTHKTDCRSWQPVFNAAKGCDSLINFPIRVIRSSVVRFAFLCKAAEAFSDYRLQRYSCVTNFIAERRFFALAQGLGGVSPSLPAPSPRTPDRPATCTATPECSRLPYSVWLRLSQCL